VFSESFIREEKNSEQTKRNGLIAWLIIGQKVQRGVERKIIFPQRVGIIK
jgi:hypothetical protein